MVRRNFKRLDVDDFKLIYKTYIRPHLEFKIFTIPSKGYWCPGRVRKLATDLILKLRKYCYTDKLKLLGLTSLKDRRERGDMIEVYKILNGKDSGQFFQVADDHYSLRGHRMKLSRKRSLLDTRKHFFSQRIINRWNSLPANVVNAKTGNSFKNAYDENWSHVDVRSWWACQSVVLQVQVQVTEMTLKLHSGAIWQAVRDFLLVVCSVW